MVHDTIFFVFSHVHFFWSAEGPFAYPTGQRALWSLSLYIIPFFSVQSIVSVVS